MREKVQFARDRIALLEDRMRELAERFRGWNIGRIVQTWVDNAIVPARESLDAALGDTPHEAPPPPTREDLTIRVPGTSF